MLKPIDWEEYLSIKRMNPSTLVAGLKSMKRLARQIKEGFGEPTNAMRFGTGLHALLLEPEEFESRFVVMPDFHLDPENKTQNGKRSYMTTTSYCDEKKKQFLSDNKGREVVKRQDYDSMLYAIESMRSRPKILELLESSQKEVTVFGSIDCIEFKGRLDLLSADCIGDLKTTADVAPSQFARTFVNMGYGFKLAIYRELVRQNSDEKTVKVIAQEVSGDFDTVLYEVPGVVLDMGLNRVRGVIADYKHALQTGVWSGVDRGIDEVPLMLPKYAMDEAEQVLDWSGVDTVSESVEESVF